MRFFTDIHNHILFGVDDGAPDETAMREMLKAAYDSGTRKICFTPHFTGAENCEKIRNHFEIAAKYVASEYPDLALFLGNEMDYGCESVAMVRNGFCLTIAGSRYVLLDFLRSSSADDVFKGIGEFLQSGYIPIVAHVERYPYLYGKISTVSELVKEGAVLQINAKAFSGSRFSSERRMAERLVSEGLVDLIASDAHDASERTPVLSTCAERVASLGGEKYCDILLFGNADMILRDKDIRVE